MFAVPASVRRPAPAMSRRIPRRCSECCPGRRVRRGMGMVVFAMTALWLSQITGHWLERRIVAHDAAALAEIAADVRTLVEGDIGGARGVINTMDTSTGRLTSLDEADLQTAGLRTVADGNFSTPSGKEVSVWIHRRIPVPPPGSVPAPGSNVIEVIVRGRGGSWLAPGGGAGSARVGAVFESGTDLLLRGPNLDLDMAHYHDGSVSPATGALTGTHAAPDTGDVDAPSQTGSDCTDEVCAGDLFAFQEVWTEPFCHSYLYRVPVPGCDDANTMAVDLDMGGNSIVDADRIEMRAAHIEEFIGDVTFRQDITFEGRVDIRGTLDVESDLEVRGQFDAERIESDEIEVTDLSVKGDATFENLEITGAVSMTVPGKLAVNDLETQELLTDTLFVDVLSADDADFNRLLADDVTVSSCTGC